MFFWFRVILAKGPLNGLLLFLAVCWSQFFSLFCPVSQTAFLCELHCSV